MTAESARTSHPLGWLDAAVVGGAAVTALACGLSTTRALGVVVVALLVVVGCWFAFGRTSLDGGRGWLPLLAVLVAVCFVGASTTPTFATFQVVALPLAWMLARGLRSALAANVAVAIAVGTGYARSAGVLEALAVEGVSFGFSIVMGAWITRIEHRSDERQQLVERLTATQAQVAALSREAGTVAERERLAMELHDTLAQSLAGVVMLAERARSRHPQDAGLGVLEDAARQALTEARGVVTAGANVPIDGGLRAALDTLAVRFRRETGLVVTVETAAEVPRGLEVVLLRCAQEGLANVRKHAGAGSVALRLVEQGDSAILTVEDDGAGPSTGDGFGLAGMRDRLAIVGGSVDLRPRDGGGAVLVVRVPAHEAVAP